jgi:2-polyprenyl-3-methyl-5-hydroxy-6-metoxy-1,4-benzoquinol methylase
METLIHCPICNSDAFKPFLRCRDFTVSKEEFSIVECDKCGFKFTNPRPGENEIGKYYQSEEYISHSNTSKGIVNALYQRVRKHTLRQKLTLVNSLSKKGAILDIGCGTGEFLSTCKSDGWKTTGIEPDPKARKFAAEKYGLDVREEAGLKGLADHSYEVITMWHVLEHVHRLNERVEELKRLKVPGGTIVVAVPNCSSLDANIYGPEWAAYDVPRHLYHFTPKDIETLFGNHGLAVKKILPMKFDSYYVSMLSEKYRSGSPNIIKAAITGLRSNMSAAEDGRTYSSQIYVLQ